MQQVFNVGLTFSFHFKCNCSFEQSKMVWSTRWTWVVKFTCVSLLSLDDPNNWIGDQNGTGSAIQNTHTHTHTTHTHTHTHTHTYSLFAFCSTRDCERVCTRLWGRVYRWQPSPKSYLLVALMRSVNSHLGLAAHELRRWLAYSAYYIQRQS